MNEQGGCHLCGLDCGKKPLLLQTAAAELRFCCEGCKGIHLMLHDIKEAPANPGHAGGNEPNG
ncbi:MAG TPA: metal-binding protein [Candidatus Accumulibacter phosphatis]|jgi:hypothetical protein|nr:metal-binding protein [Accumulibacter sp.]HRL76448.1 metal-binding protein [Candidatus Accumulibacter phosphatis]HRQ95854.1 metal-binding protein [Candidatus Accumulibacter phosphatis]